MKVPLALTSLDDKLLVYRNNSVDTIDLPFRPYILAEKSHFSDCKGPLETWKKVPEGEEREYIKFEFKNTSDVFEFKKRHKDKGSHFLSLQYSEQMFITHEDFLLQYPHTNALRVLYFDIEVATMGDGLFPRPVACPILCIGYSIWEYYNDGSKKKISHKIVKGFDIENLSDLKILNEFLTDIETIDPDVLAGYNSTTFDLPYILERCEINKIDTSRLSRGSRKPKITDTKIIIPGRIHFDLYCSNAGVIKDQTLFGIKSRSLKEIARWYNVKRTILENNNCVTKELDDIELPDEIQNLLKLFKENPERLYSYQDDDTYRTEGVGHVYIRNCITLAELMKVPLDNIINMYSSFVPKLFIARNMEKLKLINTESNFSKYNLQNGSIAPVGNKYEGALVGLYKQGLFPKVYKLDFSSMYPSSIETWNLGPDTTKLVDVQEYTGKYNCKIVGNYNWYRVPTMFEKGKYKYDFIIKIRNNEDGFLKKEIQKLKGERKKIKAELKTCSQEEKDALNSQQYAIKVVLNSIYGLLGQKSSKYGEMISAVMVASMCRWTTGKVIRKYKDSLVELDTDGLILTEPVEENYINKWLDDLMLDRFDIEDNKMEMELEEFGRAYFYRMKNYILEEEQKDGSIEHVIHGSSLKASKASKIVDRAVKLGIQWVFNDKPPEEIVREAFDFSNVPLEDFIERVNLSKEPKDYDDMQDWRVFLAEQVKMKTGQVIGKGDQVSYLVTKDKLPYSEFSDFYRGGRKYAYVGYVEDKSQLDFSYYETLVAKALEKFGISKEAIMTVDLFDSMPVKKEPLVKGNLNVVPEDDI